MKVRVATTMTGTVNPFLGMMHPSSGGGEVEVRSLRDRSPGRDDIVHVHWPEDLLGSDDHLRSRAKRARWLAWLRSERRRGAKVVWTAHNLVPHAWPATEDAWREVLASFGRLVDGVVLLSEGSRAAVRRVAPWMDGLPTCVIPHPHYREVVGAVMPARSRNIQRLLMVGRIEPYKEVPAALRAIQAAGLDVTVSGGLSPVVADDVRATATLTGATLHPAKQDAELAQLAGDHDAMLVPQPRFLNSGAVMLGLSLNLPTVVVATPSTSELLAQVGPEWLRLLDGPLTPDSLLTAVGSPVPAGMPALEANDPDRCAGRQLAFYRDLLGT